jgi:hypothetical protein
MASKPNQPEDESLRRWITEQQFDIYGIPETDLYWPRVRANLQLHERLKEWWEQDTVHTVRAHNQNQKCDSVTQWGGTAQISRGQAAFRVMESGRDPTRLGRWVWTLYRGKGNRRLRVVTAYRHAKRTNHLLTLPGLNTATTSEERNSSENQELPSSRTCKQKSMVGRETAST